jgi:hypothetical protein
MRYFYSLAEARKESGGTIGEVIGYYKEACTISGGCGTLSSSPTQCGEAGGQYRCAGRFQARCDGRGVTGGVGAAGGGDGGGWADRLGSFAAAGA